MIITKWVNCWKSPVWGDRFFDIHFVHYLKRHEVMFRDTWFFRFIFLGLGVWIEWSKRGRE